MEQIFIGEYHSVPGCKLIYKTEIYFLPHWHHQTKKKKKGSLALKSMNQLKTMNQLYLDILIEYSTRLL